MYIGKTHRLMLCFSWIMLQSKLNRQSAPAGSCRRGKVGDFHPKPGRSAEDQLQPTIKVYIACSMLREGDKSVGWEIGMTVLPLLGEKNSKKNIQRTLGRL